MFEFNFRDERYMPFEGAGAISSWKVELPSGFRQFDYQTISDVIIHISYTAQQDDSLRVQVETEQRRIATALKSTPLARLFSLRQEFPSVLNRLLHSPLNTSLTMSITPNYLPFFVASGAVQVSAAKLLLRTAASNTVENFAVSIDGNSISGFSADPTDGRALVQGRERRFRQRAVRRSCDHRHQAGQSRAGSVALRGRGSDRRYEPARCDALRGIPTDDELIRCGRRTSARWTSRRDRAAPTIRRPRSRSRSRRLRPSLPKGGGAIRGIGEKFSANPVTGTGSLSVPLALSPGRSGFGPQLSLSYDSGAGNGAFGLGWSLSLPSITRRTDKGLPQYDDAGRVRRVPSLGRRGSRAGAWRRIASGAWTRQPTTRDGYVVWPYRPRIEGLFSRIERWTRISDGDTYWRSISRDNVTTLYGKTPESRIADPAAPGNVFTWLISESRDDKGNAISYEYVAEDFGEHRSAAGPRAQSHRSEPRRQPLPQARQIRQCAADVGAA